ncbi:MAG: protein-methionine-sulfoxide reductase catalytic subunit MsrP [Arenimonas sp.]|nr:protein-methionine-sulfoxide reductase catalytic subunit MsrP [Arenimonas sp.]
MTKHSPIILPSEITPESVYLRRRELIGASLALPLLAMAGCAEAKEPLAVNKSTDSPTGFNTLDEKTRFEDVTRYNNFYEFGTDKSDPAKNAHRLQTKPWIIAVGGEAEKTGSFDLDQFLKGHTVRDRTYRLRCVEGWSMVIPWQGIPLAEIIKQFKPTSKAKYVAFTTKANRAQMPGMAYNSIDWPYREGLRMDEAMNPLTLLATGLYGKPMPNQNGAPIRLVVPWKYGFKSIKSIVRIDFVEKMPKTSWNMLIPEEYGFYSNVNPAVDHPRWSQASERRIAGNGNNLFASRIATLPFNGYAEQVAGMYKGMDLRKWF